MMAAGAPIKAADMIVAALILSQKSTFAPIDLEIGAPVNAGYRVALE